MARFGTVNEVFLDNDGNPLAGGKLFFYEPGTTTDKATYSDADETTPNTQPLLLDAYGRQPDCFFSGQARIVVKTSADVTVDDKDPIPGQAAPDAAFSGWNSLITYDSDNLVARSGLYYSAISGSNLNNDPSTSSANWQEVRLVYVYNANASYDTGDLAIDSSGNLYRSKTDANSGNTPASSPANWESLNTSTVSPVFTTPQINDASADHRYIFAVSELAADRTVTWPLLTGDDTLVFESHTQTLTNKTLTAPTLNGTPTIGSPSAFNTALQLGTGDSPTFAGLTVATASNPEFRLYDTSQALNEKYSRFYQASGAMALTLLNDAISAESVVLQATRSGYAVTGVSIGNATDDPDVTVYGDLVMGTPGKGLELSDGSTITNTRAEIPGFLNLSGSEAGTVTLTIAAGVITATSSFHYVDTESAAATDDLVTINGGANGDLLMMRPVSASRVITLKDGSGNLQLAGDFVMDNGRDRILLHYDSSVSAWCEICRSNNS